ncbi:Universal stress protein family protein [Roseovarius litorisediminis]|uniref:Universal stress protein family protein n=1 Tax=Roseovarius litorisediminis TaxID=1312363 RepID=A0A1Y5RZW8_9RHOB|nr:universal stress protein [Roseovarius litorisediminis]SLN28362.1 Universal stress protein family protein [Roseovarius litorisediminis]
MFSHIMVPVDLSVKDTLTKALDAAADMARLYDARLTLVSVCGGIQAKVSHSIETYSRLLDIFAEELGQGKGIEVSTLTISVPDPSVEVDAKLRQTIDEIGIDLVVIASHQPGWAEYIVASHGGRLAVHAPISVFVVRD